AGETLAALLGGGDDGTLGEVLDDVPDVGGGSGLGVTEAGGAVADLLGDDPVGETVAALPVAGETLAALLGGGDDGTLGQVLDTGDTSAGGSAAAEATVTGATDDLGGVAAEATAAGEVEVDAAPLATTTVSFDVDGSASVLDAIDAFPMVEAAVVGGTEDGDGDLAGEIADSATAESAIIGDAGDDAVGAGVGSLAESVPIVGSTVDAALGGLFW
ncbi:MAG: hypothetical protein IT561_22880, partial [Alphaproteobacteria bacterium]|nr:hypothetical protein [Alphaproteobacteria bacterium]